MKNLLKISLDCKTSSEIVTKLCEGMLIDPQMQKQAVKRVLKKQCCSSRRVFLNKSSHWKVFYKLAVLFYICTISE